MMKAHTDQRCRPTPTQDAGLYQTNKMQAYASTAKIKPMIHTSRCRLQYLTFTTSQETNYTGYTLKQPLQTTGENSIIIRLAEIQENFELYTVALRFKTTGGCSRSFAKRKEVKLFNQSENNLTETSDATSFISDLFSFSISRL